MDDTEKDKTPQSNYKVEEGDDAKKPRLWGFFYLILGLAGMVFSVYSVFYDVGNITPLFGTVIAGVLIGLLSVLIFIFGYRLIRRDY